MSDTWTPYGEVYGQAPTDTTEKEIETQGFNSTRIQEASWNPNNNQLTVVFSRGDERTFDNVPEEVWRGLLSAPSAGRYFGQVIQNSYTGY
jgi:hypothetical protein